MTLRPIQGAPVGAPIPDFPAGNQSLAVVAGSRSTSRPADPFAVSPSPAVPSRAHRPGLVEIRGDGDGILIFRCIPEIPAINRSSMTIVITNEPTGDYPTRVMSRLDLTTDQAKAFLLALRNAESPVIVTDSGSGFQIEFAIADDGPTFTVSKSGQERTVRRFNAGPNHDVKTMAEHLLTDLGP